MFGRCQRGFTYLGLLFAVAVSGVLLAGAGQGWHVQAQREKEAELLFIGGEFGRALASYAAVAVRSPADDSGSSESGAGGNLESLEQLVEDIRIQPPVRHLRRIYRDPMTGEAEWGLVRAGGRIVGVHSLSDKKVLRRITGARRPDGTIPEADDVRYSDWQFGAGFVPPERGGPVFVRSNANAVTSNSDSAFDSRRRSRANRG